MRFDEGFDADTQVTMSWGEPERMFIARELPHPDEDSGSEDERWEQEEQDVMQHRFEELLRVYGHDLPWPGESLGSSMTRLGHT